MSYSMYACISIQNEGIWGHALPESFETYLLWDCFWGHIGTESEPHVVYCILFSPVSYPCMDATKPTDKINSLAGGSWLFSFCWQRVTKGANPQLPEMPIYLHMHVACNFHCSGVNVYMYSFKSSVANKRVTQPNLFGRHRFCKRS